MSSHWPEEKVESIDDFQKKVVARAGHAELVFRGQANAEWDLQTSIDRPSRIDTTTAAANEYEDRLRDEGELIKAFTTKAWRLLGALEQHYSDQQGPRVSRMAVMQHFGAPTRLLDWTHSPTVAAYFACIDEDTKDGAIWWFNREILEEVLSGRWLDFGFTRAQNINFDERVFSPTVPSFVAPVYLPIPFSRASAQRGLFTLGSRLGCLHDDLLSGLLPDGTYGRLRIHALLKSTAISVLASLAVDAISLQYNGADRCGLEMSWERRPQDATR